MFQKGPGGGYGAAKDEALALDPSLRCVNASEIVGRPFYVVVRPDGRRVGEGGRLAREAWLAAFGALAQTEGEEG